MKIYFRSVIWQKNALDREWLNEYIGEIDSEDCDSLFINYEKQIFIFRLNEEEPRVIVPLAQVIRIEEE